MNASRKKAKAKSKTKSSKRKSKKEEIASVPKMAPTNVEASSAASTAIDPNMPPEARNLVNLIEKLDVASLKNDDLTAILLHCASALNLRKVIDTPDLTMEMSPASYCYTGGADDSMVSIWSGGFKVGETSLENAKASGIPPCG
ncbi:hypothetical protein [Bradyrhizobium icense]|uniref:Uncharacterized protein n=1 Tax=Bradyrhizobium icense TaxID=1274631 RepID=A0A1B1UEW8_9BRAD|nr:hypothetical protein [Bradyrhizobium icense]ANW01303.1 hypothetical protein LMTR13_15140 [Bradyrhizobium icense]